MSINHQFSSDHPPTLWWMDPSTHPKKNPPSIHHNVQLYHHPLATVAAISGQNAPFNFNLNQEEEEEEEDDEKPLLTDERENLSRDETLIIQKEAMFEKPLTPSDVGKLNRLVIPKQHAEKYFPLAANYGAGDSLDKALLLSFEDESGKSWRFRYSYWNSSQSYVLTKGWSRFVKEKRLDAGDVVMFERYREDGNRFFIGWRRRNAVAPVQDITVPQAAAAAGGGGWTRVLYNSGHPSYPNGPPLPYQPDSCLHAGARVVAITGGGGGGGSAGVENQRRRSGNSKTVRLFGVNLECQSSQPDQNIDEPTPDASAHNYSNTDDTRPRVSNYYYNHMDMISFSGDHVNQNMRHSHQG